MGVAVQDSGSAGQVCLQAPGSRGKVQCMERRTFQVPMKCSRDALKKVFMNSGSSREEHGAPFSTSHAARFCAATCRVDCGVQPEC